MESPCGHGMTHQADRHYMQQTLRNMENLLMDNPTIRDEPQCQTSRPETGQYDLADQDMEEDDLAGELDFDSEEYDTKATGPSGRSTMAERCRKRNRAMRTERELMPSKGSREVAPHRGNWDLVFSMFWGNDRDNCISGKRRLCQPWQRGTCPNE